MANKRLKGITIEIDGNTTKLTDAISKMNSAIYKANTELKDLNSALKLDPKNITLLSQKHDVLKTKISESKDKLVQLKNAQKEMGKYNSLTDEQKESYRALSVEISKTKSSIKDMKKELKETNLINFNDVKSALSSVGEVAGKVVKTVSQVVAGVSTAIAGVVAAGVNSYADLEQSIGGVETLFKDNADTVIANANKAYETAGLSANEYMETVTSFSASLLQSLGGDTEKAASVADMALIDMADNANKFGTDMSSIQNAYQGFAKQNYTMLDNLKLGYGGTKSEMERLLADAEKISGVKYDISNLSDVYNAIHVIQEDLDVTGTTAKEAATTISGSCASMKAAFDNFLNGSGSPEQLANSISVYLDNVVNAVTNLAPNIINGLIVLVQELLPKIGEIITNMLPQLLQMAQDLITTILDMIKENVEPLSDMVITVVMSIVNFILENLPAILEAGLQIILALANGIGNNLGELIPAIIDTIVKMCEIIIDNIDLIIDAAFELLMGIIKGLIVATPQILLSILELVFKILDKFTSLKDKFPEIGKRFVEGIWEGLKNSYKWIKNKIEGWVGDVLKFIKGLFGIHSPSKVMRDQVGKNLGLGVAEGIDKTVSDVQDAMKGLSAKVETSVNPTINPTANSNPLIIQIENFNNERGTDIQALAEELEFYRKNSSLAKGVA